MSFPSPVGCLSTQKLGTTTCSLDTKEFWWFALCSVRCSEPEMILSRPNKGRFVSFPVILVCLFALKSHSESLPSTWKYETSEAYGPFLLVKIEIRQCEKNYLRTRRMKVTERNLCQVPRNFFLFYVVLVRALEHCSLFPREYRGPWHSLYLWCGIVLLLLNVCYRQKCRNPCLLHQSLQLGNSHPIQDVSFGRR